MSKGPFSTIGYRGFWIQCDADACQIQKPDLTILPRKYPSLEAAKRRIRKIKGKR